MRTVYRAQCRISPLEKAYNALGDEYFFRQLAHDLIVEMPIEALTRVINFTKVDPRSEEFIAKMRDKSNPAYDREHYKFLSEQDYVEYEAKVTI